MLPHRATQFLLSLQLTTMVGEVKTLLAAVEIKGTVMAQKLDVFLPKDAGGGICRKVDFGNHYAGGTKARFFH